MTARILVISTETVGEKAATFMSEYIPGEDGLTIDLSRERHNGDRTTTLSMVNPFITRYSSTAPVGSAHVAHHLGVLPEPMDYLQYQWENAEVPTDYTPIREGDEVITPLYGGGFEVWDSRGGEGCEDSRILRRAPQPEPWEGLRKVLSEIVGEPVEPWQAQWAYGMGVRVTSEGESNE